MVMKPGQVVMSNGKPVHNPLYANGAATRAPKGMAFYGNIEHMRFIIEFEKRDRRAMRPQAERYSRAVEALQVKFGCGQSTACKSMAALRAFRAEHFAYRFPFEAETAVEDFMRIMAKAEKAGDHSAAVQARREACKIMGVYAPIKLDVEHHRGPTLASQLEAALKVLSPEARAGVEKALLELEAAKASGALQLESGEDQAKPADPGDDVEDAEVLVNGTADVG